MFPMKFGDAIRTVSKISAGAFTDFHRQVLLQSTYANQNLTLVDDRWSSCLLGAGEEKAVFCVCDHNNCVFAVEVLNERTYLNGRFVGGTYFFDLRVNGLSSVKLNPDSDFGLTFTGKIKVREFVRGYEWARFQFDPCKPSPLDGMLTGWLQTLYGAQFREYQSRYKDVHPRNVMFELRSLRESGIIVPAKNWHGELKLFKVGVQPIDVR